MLLGSEQTITLREDAAEQVHELALTQAQLDAAVEALGKRRE